MFVSVCLMVVVLTPLFHSEDTERMMDDDPRIVLKPLRTAEEA